MEQKLTVRKVAEWLMAEFNPDMEVKFAQAMGDGHYKTLYLKDIMAVEHAHYNDPVVFFFA